jgi:hypothetical protein
VGKTIQVLLDDQEYDAIVNLARENGMTTAEWVRDALTTAKETGTAGALKRKLDAVDRAAANNYPTSDIERMLEEIETGYCRAAR